MDIPHLIGAIGSAALQTVGVRTATEQPRYTVVDHIGSLEIRRYDPRIAAEAVVRGEERQALEEGFRLVAGYIFGDNAASASIAMTAPVAQTGAGQSIAMTAPVAQEPSKDGWRIQFFMPAAYTMATLPRPKDARVHLIELPAQTYAVIVFSGGWSAARVDGQRERLTSALRGTSYRIAGPTQAWFYDPPWTPPFLRRNEVAVLVEPR